MISALRAGEGGRASGRMGAESETPALKMFITCTEDVYKMKFPALDLEPWSCAGFSGTPSQRSAGPYHGAPRREWFKSRYTSEQKRTTYWWFFFVGSTADRGVSRIRTGL